MAGCSDEPRLKPSPATPVTGSIPMTDSSNRLELGHLTAITSGLGMPTLDPLGVDAGSEVLPDDPLLTNQTSTTPFPDRSDPFEFGDGVVYDTPQARENEALSIQLYGFAGAEQPKAIIHVDGKTKMLSAGEKWGLVEVLEVSPPTVRIKANGVIRVWSLLGHHEQSGL